MVETNDLVFSLSFHMTDTKKTSAGPEPDVTMTTFMEPIAMLFIRAEEDTLT